MTTASGGSGVILHLPANAGTPRRRVHTNAHQQIIAAMVGRRNLDAKLKKRIDATLSGMDETSRELTRDILAEYIWYTEQADKLQSTLEKEGSIIEVEVGGPNNRHKELREHPAVKVVAKYTTQAGSHYAKLMRYLSKAEMDQVDALEEFLKTR